jgi:hypothetical protein
MSSDSEEEETASVITAKVSASTSSKDSAKKPKAPREKEYTAVEDLMVCKAWLKTTNDHEKGVHQKVSNYSDGLERNYKLYSKEQENYDAMQRESNLRLGVI